ncbi:translation initiation factor IF-3, mitochondrial [Drosophila sulfurigaster albostrigata]|uniref:translation initiation factor IF-3, mitochondrial n=1 Tax=Drosophila sulfurigaster albostrigata TaxID=89887 RepID=UPI002D21CF66|nr:translation initiation factor IF-3, mitochondrial [Drosophila sulfurigaster albostrigata]
MQQPRLFLIHKLISQYATALHAPRYPRIPTVSSQIQQQQESHHLAFSRYLTQAASTKHDGQKPNKSQQKITLIAQNQTMSVTTLDEAQKLAKRRDLHLLRLNQTDAKTGRAIFRLVTAAEMLADDRDAKGAAKSSAEKGKKAEKSLTIGARITEHDLASRLKNIIKWLNKQHEVRILIQGNSSGADDGNAERIVKSIEATIKEPNVIGKIVQKRQKGGFIKFSIIPVATASTTASTASPSNVNPL